MSGAADAIPEAKHVDRSIGRPYERHRPEETVLYKVLQDHWLTFLSELKFRRRAALSAGVRGD